MLNSKEIAEVFRQGICIGFYEPQEVIKWADSVILNTEKPDSHIIELSMAGNQVAKNISSILSDYCNEGESDIATKVILGKLAMRLKNNINEAPIIANMLYSLILLKGYEDDLQKFNGYDDEFDLIELGVSRNKKDELAKHLLNDLKQYEEYSDLMICAG
jgi:hypothetical protein